MNKSMSAQHRAWALLLQTRARLVEQTEVRLAEAGMPQLAWYDLLWGLETAGGRVRMNALSSRLVISRSNLTRLVDRMQEAGLVTREPCSDDGRGWFCVLSPAGREMRSRMWPIYREAIDTLFATAVRDAEAKSIVAALKRVLRASSPGDE